MSPFSYKSVLMTAFLGVSIVAGLAHARTTRDGSTPGGSSMASAQNPTHRAHCFTTQRRLVQALRDYRERFGIVRTDLGSRDLFQTLLEEGLLEEMPRDPGHGFGSWTHYRHRPAGIGVVCTVHGPAPEDYPRETRTCFTIQDVLSRAVAEYNAERGVERSDLGSLSFYKTLIREGYLQGLPQDPGHGGEQPWDSYRFRLDGNGVTCSRHGHPWSLVDSPSLENLRP